MVTVDAEMLDPVGEDIEQVLADSDGARFVVLGVGLDDHAFAGGGGLLRHLDDGLLNGQGSSEEVEVSGAESNEFAPPQA